MPAASPAASSTKSSPASPSAAPRKNSRQSAELAAKAALDRTPQLSLDDGGATAPARQDGRVPLRNTYRVELALIETDPDQPRRHFDEETLNELTASIKARDIRQPLTVRWHPDSKRYRIIDGERRFRAATLAGLTDVPCVVHEEESKHVLIDQIVQNWQRSDLRPYETADALVRLKGDHSMTVSDIAQMTGKSAGEVSKLIALVERVAPDVQRRVRELAETSLTKRHLYALAGLEPQQQKRLALCIEREHLTAIDTERMVRAGVEPATAQPRPERGRPRKHVRIHTKLGLVQLTPDSPNFDDQTLIAMLHQARRELAETE